MLKLEADPHSWIPKVHMDFSTTLYRRSSLSIGIDLLSSQFICSLLV
jgi:hypothetical protein